MRISLLILSLFLLHLNLYSQDSLLKQFKFRDVKYRAIQFQFYGSGQYNRIENNGGNNKSRGGNGSLGAGYSFARSTDRILLEGWANLGTSYNKSKSTNIQAEYKDRGFSLQPSFSIHNKWFSGKMFMELGTDAEADVSSFKDITTNPSNTRKDQRENYFLSVTVGAGTGRLENVTAMQNALWLYDALQREKRLTRSLAPDELNGLGNAIVKANNTRVLDSRKRIQFILETVDHMLQQNSLINNPDITYFSNLNDILFFAINLPRLSGTEKFIRFTPGRTWMEIDQSQSIYDARNSTKTTYSSAILSAGINRFIPVNLRHQNNYGISVYGNYQENNSAQKFFVSGILQNETSVDPLIRQVGANFFFEHAIYPNTRTVANLRLTADGGFQKLDETSMKYGSVALTGSLNYFISYRTRFTCSVGAIYQSNIYDYNYFYSLQQVPENLRLNATAGLEISL